METLFLLVLALARSSLFTNRWEAQLLVHTPHLRIIPLQLTD